MKKFSYKSHWLITFIATCGYVGYAPIAPGTAASIVAMIAWYILPVSKSILATFIILNLLFFVGAIVAEKVMFDTKTDDPSFIVIDEWLGMWLSVLFLPKMFWLLVLALVVFRFFDILKPWPISFLEKNTPGGLGVMLDDTCAGVFTCLIMHLFLHIYEWSSLALAAA